MIPSAQNVVDQRRLIHAKRREKAANMIRIRIGDHINEHEACHARFQIGVFQGEQRRKTTKGSTDHNGHLQLRDHCSDIVTERRQRRGRTTRALAMPTLIEGDPGAALTGKILHHRMPNVPALSASMQQQHLRLVAKPVKVERPIRP